LGQELVEEYEYLAGTGGGEDFAQAVDAECQTNIGTEAVVRAPADGYTLLMVGVPNAINATLYEKLNFVFLRDIAPVAAIERSYIVTLVNPHVPANTFPEFITYAKANPGRINVASAGNGTPSHMAGELLKMLTGVRLIHVPYRGEPVVCGICKHVSVLSVLFARCFSSRAAVCGPAGGTRSSGVAQW
jgi:Tripartite tricarboxylate transporter family receptor